MSLPFHTHPGPLFTLPFHTHPGPLFNMLVSFATGFYSLLISAAQTGGGGGGAPPDQEGDVTIIDGLARVSLHGHYIGEGCWSHCGPEIEP